MNDNKPKRSMFQRILAIIAVIIIVGLVITTTILGIIGLSYTYVCGYIEHLTKIEIY